MKRILMAAMLCAALAYGGENAKGPADLSEGIRGLLSQEMLQIEQGMHAIFSYMVRGDYAPIRETALQIRDSFIFKKNLTEAQRNELVGTLPPEFIDLDQSFHEAANDLAGAAEFGDMESVEEYYGVMTRKCVQCHSTFATHRFSGFKTEE